ncbi:MAG: hypothetical protein FJ118_16285 [Deltaproteobacteria bacterium]|nr:hypothetical protein [Deltaproteobacteria bacterium]
MIPDYRSRWVVIASALTAALAWIFTALPCAVAVDSFDVVSGVIENSRLKGKSPLEKLNLTADRFRAQKLDQSDMSFFLLDWADQYLRTVSDPLERLQRWAELTNDDKLRHLRIPRDFLNRMLLAEYLAAKTSYLQVPPYKKLEIIAELERRNLVDWSVALAYARIYAGGVISGAQAYEKRGPLEALKSLKLLIDQGLVSWHYRVPTEAVLSAEALALDQEYQAGSSEERLVKVRELESKGLISELTKRELEKLPAWRRLVDDPSFLSADAATKRDRVSKMRASQLISQATAADLINIFRLKPISSPLEPKPGSPPKQIPASGN